jgi:lysophospholipase L1-like esterase
MDPLANEDAATTYLFAGDELTAGVYGVSYVSRVAEALYRGWAGLEGQAVNAGRASETVGSLLRRLDTLLGEYEPAWVILAVGSNDVWIPWLSDHSFGWWLWRGYRQLRWGQRPTIDLDEFGASYRALVDRAQQGGAKVLACTASPLGERLSTPVNRQLARANGILKKIALDREVPVADVWQAFVDELAPLPKPSRHIPGEWLITWLDRLRLRYRSPDQIAQRRGLHLTYDGIHLNSRGADVWARTVLIALARAQGATIRVARGSANAPRISD